MSSNRRMPAYLLQQLVSSFVTQALQFDGGAATPPNAAMDTNNAAFLRPRPPAQRSHRLLDPADQLRQVRFKLQTLMHDEYVETKDLAKVLNWSDEIRQKGINNTPLIDLIGMIVSSSDSGANKLSLILPLYNALLCSPESKPFLTHAELYKPAIANIFRANSAPNTLAAVQSFWSLFDLTPSTAYRTIPPDQLSVLRDHFRIEYHVFLQKLPIADFVRILPQLSTAIRQQALFLSAPLAAAVDAVKGLPNSSKYRAAYAAFIGTAEERRLFAQRLHIFYPWMVEKLRHKQWFATKLGIVLCLIQKQEDVPQVLVDLLHQSLLAAFSWACATRNFSAADQIWQYRNDKIAAVIAQQQQDQLYSLSDDVDALNLSADFRFADVLAFTIHLWTNGNKTRAQHIMHFYLSRQFLLRNEHSKKYVNMMLRDLNALDIDYRQNLYKIAKGSNAADEREKCHRNFVSAVYEKLTN